jgi:hypothetical protein
MLRGVRQVNRGLGLGGENYEENQAEISLTQAEAGYIPRREAAFLSFAVMTFPPKLNFIRQIISIIDYYFWLVSGLAR